MCRFNSLIGAKPRTLAGPAVRRLEDTGGGLRGDGDWEEDYVLIVNTGEKKLLSNTANGASTAPHLSNTGHFSHTLAK